MLKKLLTAYSQDKWADKFFFLKLEDSKPFDTRTSEDIQYNSYTQQSIDTNLTLPEEHLKHYVTKMPEGEIGTIGSENQLSQRHPVISQQVFFKFIYFGI